MRKTKIVATIGPASDDPKVLRQLIDGGLDVARLSLAHDPVERVLERYRLVRQVSQEARRNVGMLIDLPGPKIRAAQFAGDGVLMDADQQLRLRPGYDQSTPEVMEVGYDALLADLQVGDVLAIGDGTVQLKVTEIGSDDLQAKVTHGGRLVGRPGVHIPSDRLSLASPTDDDLQRLEPFLEENVDMVAVSFVGSGADVRRLGTLPPPDGPLVVSKIETRPAVENIEDIIDASGAIMVARGDLGVEFPIEQVPVLQKFIIRLCIAKGLPVITATQMLESMITSPSPTRAEASDIANAVYDGTSAVMLSAETAVGQDPVRVVQTMAQVTTEADKSFDEKLWGQLIEEVHLSDAPSEGRSITDAITMAAWRVASEKSLAALLCISGSGLTVRSMARFRPRCPILGFSNDPRVVKQLTLSWGVTAFLSGTAESYEDRVREAIATAKENGTVKAGDVVGVLAGLSRSSRVTDVLRLVKVR